MLTVSLSHIAGFVQSILNPSSLTIYYKKYFSLLCHTRSTYLPQFYQASSPRICNLIVKILNGAVLTIPSMRRVHSVQQSDPRGLVFHSVRAHSLIDK